MKNANNEKQVTYFEAIYHGGIEQHYVKDTKEFENWISVLKKFDTSLEVTYIAYNDGSIEGEAVGYTKIG